jgi:hypothetical protein
LQVPKSKINVEWLERDMVSVGVAKVVKDLLYFMRREVLHQQGYSAIQMEICNTSQN